MSTSEWEEFDFVQMKEIAEMNQSHENAETETIKKIRSLPDIWTEFGKLIHFKISFHDISSSETIYANSRNQIKLVISIKIEDTHGNPLKVGPDDFKDLLYLCDRETQDKLDSPWHLSDENDTAIGDVPIYVYKYLSCSTITSASVSRNFSVGVIIPNIGDFNTSDNGTNTKNGNSGGKFHSPSYVAVTALPEIDYSQTQNIKLDIRDFEQVHSNLGWTSRFSREGPYDEHNDGKCERRLVHILPERSVTRQQKFKKYEIIDYKGIKKR